MNRLQWWLDATADLLMGAGILVAILMAVHVVADVAAKFLFNFPLAGTLEIVAHYYMVGLIFFPLAYVQRRDSHIAADLLTRLLPRSITDWISCVSCLAMAGFAALLAWRSSVDAIRSLVIVESVQTSGYFVYIFPARWFVPLGLSVMGCFALLQAVRQIMTLVYRR